ncbi:MAG: hypothetical protein NW701_18710 [Nitrospira sp.]
MDLEERRYISSLTTKAPLLKDVVNEDLLNAMSLSDCTCAGQLAQGLGFACHSDNLGISFNLHSRWQQNLLSVQVELLNEHGIVEHRDESVRHASEVKHVIENEVWIKNRVKLEMKTGADIWTRKEAFFPGLRFCSSAEQQLCGIEKTFLSPTIKRLMELDKYTRDWSDGPFDAHKITSKATPESTNTLNSYGSHRTFLCPDGQSRLFSWHVRLTPGSWRIYFFPDSERRQLIIGYVGPKLPTVEYPT